MTPKPKSVTIHVSPSSDGGELTPERQRIILKRTAQLREAQRSASIASVNFAEAKKARDKAEELLLIKAGRLYESIDGEVQLDLPTDSSDED